MMIDEVAALAATGENRLEGVRQLIMRGMNLTSFESSCAARLQSLTVLSLSNNSLRDVESFKPLINLVEVNVNFNAITSLEGLACPNLQRLYLSNNLIASTERFVASFPKLRTLCLFKNILPDLSSALQPLSRSLTDLRGLDLDGNPCSRSRGYKHRVIRCCPRLHELDGEELTQLDRDLSSLYFEEQQKSAAWDSVGDGDPSSSSSSRCPRRRRRPVTAPATTTSRSRPNERQQLTTAFERAKETSSEEENELAASSEPGPAGPEHRIVELGRLPSGEAQLLTSDRLNNDPQLLCYLAQGVLADPCGSPRDAIEALRREQQRRRSSSSLQEVATNNAATGPQQPPRGKREDGGGGEKGEGDDCRHGAMVETGRAGKGAGGGGGRAHSPDSRTIALERQQQRKLEGKEIEEEKEEEATAVLQHNYAKYAEPRSEPLSPPLPPPPLPTAAAGLDPSNPYATIRKLLQLVEALQLDRARRNSTEGEEEEEEEEENCRNFQAAAKFRGVQEERKNKKNNNRRKNDDGGDDDDDDNASWFERRTNPSAHSNGNALIRNNNAGEDVGENHHHHYYSAPKISREDLRRLRLENRNMHLLLVENRELKQQVREESVNAESTRRKLAAELSVVKGQLMEVVRELEGARKRLLPLQPAAALVQQGGIISRWSGSSSSGNNPPLENMSASTSTTGDSMTDTGTALNSSTTSSCSGTLIGGWSCSSNNYYSRATPFDWRRTGGVPVVGADGAEETVLKTSLAGVSKKPWEEGDGGLMAANRMSTKDLLERRQDLEGGGGGGDGGGSGGGDDNEGDDDEELEELFRRNGMTLREIRRDLGMLVASSSSSSPSDREKQYKEYNNNNHNVMISGKSSSSVGGKLIDYELESTGVTLQSEPPSVSE
ncbi:unnamed protein product, partial [Pylaiella littoralis]